MAEFYNDDKTWATLAQEAHYAAKQMTDALVNGLNMYNEWQSFRNARSNATIATGLGVSEAAVAEMDAAYAAMKTLYDAANNVAVSQGDHFYSLRKFS